jgi:uncharacterized membrane protein YkoI
LCPSPPSFPCSPGCGKTLSVVRLSELSEVVKILIPFTSNSHLHSLHSAQEPTKVKEIQNVYVKKVLLGVAVALVALVGAGVAYAASSGSSQEDADDSYKGSVSVAGKNESSAHKLAKIDEAAAEQAALKAAPGTVHETELETSDNSYLVYDIEIAGKDGKAHEVTVDAGNGKVLHQDLEEEADEPDERGETEAADDGSGDTEEADDGSGDTEDAD